jgi:uncharacterized protein YceK
VIRISILLLLFSFVSGCGTLKTNFDSDAGIRNDLVRYKSNCTELARLYSGVLHNLCLLNGNTTDPVKQIILGYYFIDTVPSAVLDTLFMPYTLYSQSSKGNIKVN